MTRQDIITATIKSQRNIVRKGCANLALEAQGYEACDDLEYDIMATQILSGYIPEIGRAHV